MHGGGPPVVAGKPLDSAYKSGAWERVVGAPARCRCKSTVLRVRAQRTWSCCARAAATWRAISRTQRSVACRWWSRSTALRLTRTPSWRLCARRRWRQVGEGGWGAGRKHEARPTCVPKHPSTPPPLLVLRQARRTRWSARTTRAAARGRWHWPKQSCARASCPLSLSFSTRWSCRSRPSWRPLRASSMARGLWSTRPRQRRRWRAASATGLAACRFVSGLQKEAGGCEGGSG